MYEYILQKSTYTVNAEKREEEEERGTKKRKINEEEKERVSVAQEYQKKQAVITRMEPLDGWPRGARMTATPNTVPNPDAITPHSKERERKNTDTSEQIDTRTQK